jgi:hypothetical protein
MKLSNACSRYGADMGRREYRLTDPNTRVRLHVARVRLDSGGYDSGGAYWGMGAPLYRVWSDDAVETPTGPESVDYFLRAWDREEAKEHARVKYPQATFYR